MQHRLIRVLVSAGVGAGLVLAWWGFFRLFPELPLRLAGDEQCRQDFGCGLGAALISVILTVSLVIAVSVAVGWGVLWAVGVRPAWLMAIVGPVAGWLLLLLADRALHPTSVRNVWEVVVGMGVGYGLIALISGKRRA